jgi:hypothetical protein
MPCRTPFFGCVLLAVSAVTIVLGPARLEAGPAEAATDKSWPTQITATYKVTFNGFEIGSFRFQSQISPQGYTLDGSAELSALLGAFQWKGVTRSSGTVQGDAPKPAGYTFDFKGNSKTGAVKMSFKEGSVANVSLVPPAKPPSPETVPVKDQHLKDVLDPLSAVMALLRGGMAQPCGRKLAIFDGKQRFDLLLSPRGQRRITETRPSGQPGLAFVCRVRYVPIAGYKMNEETKSMAESSGIEVALRPIPAANLLVPYEVTVPTIAGPAKLTSQRIEIETAGRGQIALVH